MIILLFRGLKITPPPKSKGTGYYSNRGRNAGLSGTNDLQANQDPRMGAGNPGIGSNRPPLRPGPVPAGPLPPSDGNRRRNDRGPHKYRCKSYHRSLRFPDRLCHTQDRRTGSRLSGPQAASGPGAPMSAIFPPKRRSGKHWKKRDFTSKPAGSSECTMRIDGIRSKSSMLSKLFSFAIFWTGKPVRATKLPRWHFSAPAKYPKISPESEQPRGTSGMFSRC